MATLDIDDFDPTPYPMAPMLPAESTVTLAADLHACKPSEPTLQVEKTAKKMYEAASELKQVFITRVELAGINMRMRTQFDTVSDRFWFVTRQQVLHWANYAHEGMDMLSDEEKAKIDHADKLEKAEVARELDKHLFSDGLKFLAKPFNQQVTLMASRLSFIAASNKFSAYQEVIGADLLNTLNVLQGRYETMVRERNMQEDEGAEVKRLRHKLQRRITLYANAVLAMLDEDDPASIDVVLDALRPMVNIRTPKRGSTEVTNDTNEPEGEGEPLPEDMLEGAPEAEAEDGDSE